EGCSVAAAFGKSSESAGEGSPSPGTASTSIIGRGSELTGDLEGSGQLRVEGRVDGTIRMDGEVQVAAEGAVEGRIEADEVVAAGRVTGTIAARTAVRLEDGCQVDADVHCPVLELQEGGRLNGRVDMSGDEVPAEEPSVGRRPATGPEPGPGPAGEEDGDEGEETEADATDGPSPG
ncbi:MAG: bactofilin family protein, partial [Gemmatimonadota bacterium]